MLEEKKSIPTIQVLRHRELAQKIAALTEDIRKLTSEKALLLNQLACVDDHGITEVKHRVSSMESSLGKLNQQEGKNTAELNNVLKEYVELKEQAAEFDPDELMRERLALRPSKERSAVARIQSAYGNRYQSLLMQNSKRNVADLLNENAEVRSIRERLHKEQPSKTHQQQESLKRHQQER